MRRIKTLVTVVAAFTVVMLVALILPATAEAQEADSIVYFPYGNGATYSCTGGPPFIFDSAGTGNCTVQQIGSPAGLLCEVPTTITFVLHGRRWVADASLCHSSTDAANLTTITTTTTTITTTTTTT